MAPILFKLQSKCGNARELKTPQQVYIPTLFVQEILNYSYATCRDLIFYENCYMAMSQTTKIQSSNAIYDFISLYIYREFGLLNGIMTHCQKCALVCKLRYFTGGSPRSGGDGRSCQSNLGYTVIGQWLCDSAISAVSTGVCLLNFVFISFVINWPMGLDIFVLYFCQVL